MGAEGVLMMMGRRVGEREEPYKSNNDNAKVKDAKTIRKARAS